MTAGESPERQDVTVRWCTVRVRRRGGWAWGDPESYLVPVREAIERALGQVAADAGIPPDTDVVLTEPVTLHVAPDGRVRLGDTRALTDLVRAAAGDAPVDPGASVASVAPVAAVAVPDDPGHAQAGALPRAGVRGPRTPVGDLLAAALAAWSRAGRLDVVVSGWTPVARASWLRALRQAVAAGTGLPVDERSVARVAEVVLSPPGRAAGGSPEVRALVLAGAVIAAHGGRLPDREALDAVLRVAGTRATDGAASATPGTAPAATAVAELAAGQPSPSTSPAGATPRSGAVVVPALPFLVIVQLGRLGYLEGAATALAVSGLGQPDAILAAMLAGKVLAPPAHGWLRSPAERDAVRFASGLEDDDVEAAVAAWEQSSPDSLAPLVSVLVGLYAADRSRFAEVAVTRTPDHGTVVGEPDGLPMGWTSAPEELAAVLAQLGDPPVAESERFAGLVERLAPRRALLGTTAEVLERHLAAAVGTGLGSLAQDLWGASTDPVTALDRLGDLEARVEVADALTIGIPRGQRWLDLKRAGLVDAWPVAWAPGGRWELVTW